MPGVPAHDDQVGPDGQADQGPGRVAGHDLIADRDAGILLPPALQQLRQPGGSLGGHRAGPGPGVDGQQAGLMQARLLEREGKGAGAVVQVTHADADLPARDGVRVADHHDRADGVGRRVPADRSQRHRGERPGAAGADDQHRRAGSALGDRLRGRARQRIGHDHQAGTHPGGPGCRGVQGLVAFGPDEIGDVVALRPDLEPGQPGRERRGGHDPQQRGVPDGLPGGPLHRPQGLHGTIRSGHDGPYVHG